MSKLFGYDFAIKIGEKVFCGVQTEDFNLTPLIKESITKKNRGNKTSVITGHEATFAIAGLVEVVAEDDKLTELSSDEILELALKKGDDAVIDYKYQRGTLGTVSGKAIISGYTEKTDSENEASYTLNLKTTGDITFQKAGA